MPDAVVVAPVNLRMGPGTEYEIISTLRANQVLTVIGRIADTTWLQVITDQMQEGWVVNWANLVTLNLPAEGIPIVSPPPTPTATPTPSPPAENIRFWADSEYVSAGACIMVHWHASNVNAYWIDGRPGAGDDGSFQTCPCQDETHTLRAIKRDGSEVNLSVTINVSGQCGEEPPGPGPITPTPVPVILIAKPSQKAPCPLTGDCVFSVEGTSTNVVTDLQTIVIFIDPGGGNWWPQNLDFPLTIQSSGDWGGKAKIGVGPQPSGTEFRIIALLMNRTQVPTTMQPYTTLPPSITLSGSIRLVCDTCFYVEIVSPQGTHIRENAPSFPVSNTVEISWEPSECVMIVQYYRNDRLEDEYKSVTSGTEINVGAPSSGETEIKIWREGFEEQTDNIWVWVE
jgi:hypothetical protein